jgi:hypothetical protein
MPRTNSGSPPLPSPTLVTSTGASLPLRLTVTPLEPAPSLARPLASVRHQVRMATASATGQAAAVAAGCMRQQRRGCSGCCGASETTREATLLLRVAVGLNIEAATAAGRLHRALPPPVPADPSLPVAALALCRVASPMARAAAVAAPWRCRSQRSSLLSLPLESCLMGLGSKLDRSSRRGGLALAPCSTLPISRAPPHTQACISSCSRMRRRRLSPLCPDLCLASPPPRRPSSTAGTASERRRGIRSSSSSSWLGRVCALAAAVPLCLHRPPRPLAAARLLSPHGLAPPPPLPLAAHRPAVAPVAAAALAAVGALKSAAPRRSSDLRCDTSLSCPQA